MREMVGLDRSKLGETAFVLKTVLVKMSECFVADE